MAALPDGFECMNFPMGRENSLAGVETVFPIAPCADLGLTRAE
jgi:hypothetical protein